VSRTLAHLSDIHFGTVDPLILAPLIETVRRLAPHVVVVSGDLTQRARTQEFLAARAFLDQLPKPQIVVPGNHDVPLYNLYGRFVERLDRYQNYITPELEPCYADEEIAVLGTNTARALIWKGGRINAAQIFRIKERLCNIDRKVTKIVVTHHPFDLPQGFSETHLVGGARMAMGHLAESGADLLLAGHMHVSSVCRTVLRYQIAGHSALVVQAGTAASTRGRGELNSFNCIRIECGVMTIERWSWSPESRRFAATGNETFRKTPDGWEPLRDRLMSPMP
jgi:3',5'-cyclic AMP phosphodiesterase CpdA